MTIHVYDGMAVLRRKFNNDPMGTGPCSVIVDMLTMPKSDVPVWCFEGRNHLADRRAIFPGYKVRPSTMDDGLHALISLVRDALKHTRALQVAVPGREADDVIAHLCQTHGIGGDSMLVHTIDRDLKALETPNVKVDCGNVVIKLDDQDHILPADQIRLYKTLVGDTSDRIPGVKGFGPKAYAACQPALLNQAIQMLLAGRPADAAFIHAGVKEAMAHRICEPEQAELLRAYWKIIGFMPLPDDWDKYVVPGKEDATAANAVLQRFHH